MTESVPRSECRDNHKLLRDDINKLHDKVESLKTCMNNKFTKLFAAILVVLGGLFAALLNGM